MSDIKYTPGPWEAHKTKKGIAILHPLINNEGEYKGQRGGYHVVIQERQLSPEGIETKLEMGNAHLIAAAPEMLEALIKSTKYLIEDQKLGITADRLNQPQIDINIIIIEAATGMKIEDVIK